MKCHKPPQENVFGLAKGGCVAWPETIHVALVSRGMGYSLPGSAPGLNTQFISKSFHFIFFIADLDAWSKLTCT